MLLRSGDGKSILRELLARRFQHPFPDIFTIPLFSHEFLLIFNANYPPFAEKFLKSRILFPPIYRGSLFGVFENIGDETETRGDSWCDSAKLAVKTGFFVLITKRLNTFLLYFRNTYPIQARRISNC